MEKNTESRIIGQSGSTAHVAPTGGARIAGETDSISGRSQTWPHGRRYAVCPNCDGHGVVPYFERICPEIVDIDEDKMVGHMAVRNKCTSL